MDNLEIISGVSIGSIKLGMTLAELWDSIKTHGLICTHEQYTVGDKEYTYCTIGQGILTATCDESMVVRRVSCRTPYVGLYRNRFRAGMTVGEILSMCKSAMLNHGVLIIDKDFGAGYVVPERHHDQFYDDIDSVKQLPLSMVLDEIQVIDKDWWH